MLNVNKLNDQPISSHIHLYGGSVKSQGHMVSTYYFMLSYLSFMSFISIMNDRSVMERINPSNLQLADLYKWIWNDKFGLSVSTPLLSVSLSVCISLHHLADEHFGLLLCWPVCWFRLHTGFRLNIERGQANTHTHTSGFNAWACCLETRTMPSNANQKLLYVQEGCAV